MVVHQSGEEISNTAIITAMTDSEEPYLAQAVNSVFSQNVATSVIVVVRDDAEWVDRVLTPHPALKVKRIGLCDAGTARNLGVAEADTRYVSFLDGDDFWLPGKVKAQLSVAGQTSADLVGADHVMVNDAGRKIAFGLSRHIPMTSSWLVRRAFMLERPFPAAVRHEDGIWWVENRRHGRFVRVPKVLLAYRVRLGSRSAGSPSKARKEFIARLSRNCGASGVILLSSMFIYLFFRRRTYTESSNWAS